MTPEKGQPMDDAQFRTWKLTLVPLLYDWFSNHNLTWPSQACRWGPRVSVHPYKDTYRVYLSEQTPPEEQAADPPKLQVIEVDVPKPNVAAAEVVSTWSELTSCPWIKELKTIVHPGEVNKIREVPEHPEVVVTHTDAPELYVWNTATQPNCTKNKETKRWTQSTADAKLTGHEKDALFPLATCNAAPLVASGGTDKLLLLWDLRDLQDTLLAKKDKDAQSSTTDLSARQKLKGHKKTVEDLVFQPRSTTNLASVGDDAQVLLWDTSSGNSPIAAIDKAHGNCDVHTVDWSALQDHLLATGAADGSLKVWDKRKLPLNGSTAGGSLHTFVYHTDAIMRVEWHPTEKGILASGGEDHLVVVWSLGRATAGAVAAGPRSSSKGGSSNKGSDSSSREAPPEVLFKHVGHRAGKVVDFQWCPCSAWTVMSVSDDTAADPDMAGSSGRKDGGGTLQIWRMSDLLYLPEEQVVAELEQSREWIITGREQQKFKKPPRALDDKTGVREEPASAGAKAVVTALDATAAQGNKQPQQQDNRQDRKRSSEAVDAPEADKAVAAADGPMPMDVEKSS